MIINTEKIHILLSTWIHRNPTTHILLSFVLYLHARIHVRMAVNVLMCPNRTPALGFVALGVFTVSAGDIDPEILALRCSHTLSDPPPKEGVIMQQKRKYVLTFVHFLFLFMREIKHLS